MSLTFAPLRTRADITLTCPEGHTWEALGYIVYGDLELDDHLAHRCPDCGEHAESWERS